MSSTKKVVLISRRGYDPSHEDLLLGLIQQRIELFCAVGVDCELWEEVMDELVVGPEGDGEWLVTTTSHPDETVAEVIEFAEGWHLEEPGTLQVIEV